MSAFQTFEVRSCIFWYNKINENKNCTKWNFLLSDTSYTYTFHERSRSMESMLIEKSVQGDVASFEKLIVKYNRYVYNIAFRMMGNEEDAKDMSQETLIKAFKAISQFKMESSFSTWLYRITFNVCKDELR